MNRNLRSHRVKPPNQVTVLLAVVIALSLGVAVGIGSYTFAYAPSGRAEMKRAAQP